MFGFLRGKVLECDDYGIVIDVNGVGYQLLVPQSILKNIQLGDSVEVFVHTNVRENAIELFGFSNSWEKKVFLLLISVSGVGPRTALAILNALDAEQILTCIAHEDSKGLSQTPGVGKKTAERLIIELNKKAAKLLADWRAACGSAAGGLAAGGPNTSGKIRSSLPLLKSTNIWDEALEALTSLGYDESKARETLRTVVNQYSKDDIQPPLDQLVRQSLQWIAKL